MMYHSAGSAVEVENIFLELTLKLLGFKTSNQA